MKLQEQKREWLAEKLRQYAYNHNINMRGVADILGVSPQYLSAILNGKKSVSDNFVNKIEQLMQTEFTHLAVVSENETPYNATFERELIDELRADKMRLHAIIEDLRTILKNVTTK